MLKKIVGDSLLTEGLVLPYELYSDEDIRNRFIYLEASRGCPFKCEFCLSALDKTAVPFQMDLFLVELTKLFQRGARTFKFIDRTFNLRLDDCERLLRFFLECIEQQQDPDLLLHFELIPDHLPDRLRGLIARFPRGTLQFEIGIQTWNPEVQARISRRQNNEKSEANLIWLREFSHAHLHVDLIAGLPGETLESFATGFDRLVQLRPHEIQVGILKRLRGTPIIRHTAQFDLRFNPNPPYNLVASTLVPFAEMQKLQRFARYWDLIGNSGGYARTLPWLLGTTPGSGRRQVEARISPFARFAALSQWIYSRTDSTYQFSPQRLFTLIKTWIEETIPDSQEALQALEIDYTTRLSRRRPNKADASVGASTGKPANEPSESNKLAGKTPIRLRHQRLVTPPEEGVHLRP